VLFRSGYNFPKSKNCGMYLGIYIAERVLSKVFEGVHRMPIRNHGYDFICSNGYKIDVKSACLHSKGKYVGWTFIIKKNKIADYFLCLAFDNRESLNPLHMWLIPGNIINHLAGLGIGENNKSVLKWAKYERSLDKVISCCNHMKGNEDSYDL